MVWSQCDNHHSTKCEVDKAHQHEVEEQEKFSHLPLKSNHGVKDKSVHNSLNGHIYCLYSHLQN